MQKLKSLQEEEREVSASLSIYRQRFNELLRLVESSKQFGGAIEIQKDRLNISEWLQSIVKENQDPLASISDGDKKLQALVEALSGVEIQLRTQPALSDRFEKEKYSIRSEVEDATNRLSAIRQEINLLEQKSDEVRKATYRQDKIERFVGRLEQALETFDRADDGSVHTEIVKRLKSQIDVQRRIYSEEKVTALTEEYLREVAQIAGNILPKLDGEWPDAPIEIVIEDLTIRVVHRERKDYLWEIGSGANWLAYHVAVTLALQRFFLSIPNHPASGFLVYDQPSQVYFPTGFEHHDPEVTGRTRGEDISAVRAVFAAVGDEIVKADGRLQAIILDHAGPEVWGELKGVTQIADWREGQALVPADWL